jgi:hypothetical protein
MSRLTSLLLLIPILAGAACATAGSSATGSSIAAPTGRDGGNTGSSGNQIGMAGMAGMAGDGPTEVACAECGAIPMPADVTQAVESRIAVLKARGGDCSRYAAVLEQSYRSGRITIRPYMWRVGRSLASGEGRPNGEMTLAREIDSLNVGVRTVDDVVFSMEHEAVHITFDLASGIDASEEKANQIVRGCKA